MNRSDLDNLYLCIEVLNHFNYFTLYTVLTECFDQIYAKTGNGSLPTIAPANASIEVTSATQEGTLTQSEN